MNDFTPQAPSLEARGLSKQLARARLTEFGLNELEPSMRRSLILQILSYFVQPLVAILLIASLASALLGESLNAVIIVVMVLGSIALDFVQTSRSQNAADHLRTKVAPSASVLRDGIWTELPRREIVPGDVIRLVAGDLVPADARLLSAKDLHVQQAALTGESMPGKRSQQLQRPARDRQPGVPWLEHRQWQSRSAGDGDGRKNQLW